MEWVVVDDGSSDHTAELLIGMAESAPFPVRLLRQPNRGKHVALNRGIPMARGSMAVLIDSDDELLPGGLARLLALWQEIPAERRSDFFGVVGRCVDETGRGWGTAFLGPSRSTAYGTTPSTFTGRAATGPGCSAPTSCGRIRSPSRTTARS